MAEHVNLTLAPLEHNEFSPAVSFGGVKQSGLGYDLGDAAVESLTNLKNTTVALTAAKSVTP